jgi:hypothetical protein
MGIGLRVTGRTTAIGSCKFAVLRRSVSVILTGSHGFRSRRTVTLEKSSRSQTSSSMMVESLDIVGWLDESGMVQPNSIFRFPKRNQGCNGSLPASSPVDHGKVETYFPTWSVSKWSALSVTPPHQPTSSTVVLLRRIRYAIRAKYKYV